MPAYLLNRLLRGFVTAAGVVVVSFFLIRLSGDPVALYVGDLGTKEQIVEMRTRLGLDKPLLAQLTSYVAGVVRGDLGTSLTLGEKVSTLLLERAPVTFAIASMAITVALLLAVPAGILAAVKPGSVIDRLIVVAASALQAVPSFWLGIMLIVIVAVWAKLLPTSGVGGLRYLILPAITLAAYPLASITRLTRSAMLEVLAQDYVRTARSKGVRALSLLFKHGLRNALLTVVTYLGIQFGVLMGGTVVTETVFGIPGMGSLIVRSVFGRDYAVVQGALLIVALLVVATNVIVDVLYTVMDPRVQF